MGAKAAKPEVPPPERVGAALRGGIGPGKASTCWDVLDTQGLEGKTAVITGANTGIGYHTALALAYGGVNVVLACRDLVKGEASRAAITSVLDAAGVKPKIDVMQLDLASLASVRRFADGFTASGRPLHMLCLNAGIMAVPDYRESEDGIELQFASNHLGHFALTQALLGTLEASAPARVVSVSSVAHQHPNQPLDVERLPPRRETYADWGAYQQSKLANILFSNELSRRLQERGVAVTSNALHPGVIPTELGRQQFLKGSGMLRAFQDRSVVQGAATSVFLLTAATLEGVTGKYFQDCAEHQPSASARDAAVARRLWERSEELVQRPPRLVQ